MRRLAASWVLVMGVAALAWALAALTGRVDVHAGILPDFLWMPLVLLAVPAGLWLLGVAASGLTRNRGTFTHGLER